VTPKVKITFSSNGALGDFLINTNHCVFFAQSVRSRLEEKVGESCAFSFAVNRPSLIFQQVNISKFASKTALSLVKAVFLQIPDIPC